MPDAALCRFRPWFYAAAVYNFAWGVWAILQPAAIFELLGMVAPMPLAFWQVVGMMVLVWTPAYLWVASAPSRHPHFIVIALLGKVLGPIGFVVAVSSGTLPLAFAPVIVANDLVWWPAFSAYLRTIATDRGGWWSLLSGR
jgi:hypothetical protein